MLQHQHQRLLLLPLLQDDDVHLVLLHLLSLLFHAVNLGLHQSLLPFEEPLEFVNFQDDLSVERELGFALII